MFKCQTEEHPKCPKLSRLALFKCKQLMRWWAHMMKYIHVHMWTHQGANKPSSQTSPQQAPMLSCAQCICRSTDLTAGLVRSTGSCKRSTNLMWPWLRALKTATTQDLSSSLISCHAAAAMVKSSDNGVTHA